MRSVVESAFMRALANSSALSISALQARASAGLAPCSAVRRIVAASSSTSATPISAARRSNPTDGDLPLTRLQSMAAFSSSKAQPLPTAAAW